MKKFISLFSAILLVGMLSTMLFACQPNTPPDDVPAAPENVSVYVPDGAPAMAIANIIKSGKIGADTKANVTLTTGQDVIAKAQKGEADNSRHGFLCLYHPQIEAVNYRLAKR